MNKPSLSHAYTKEEKEYTLSLFRIPLTFFSDDKTPPTPETKIKLDATKPQDTTTVDLGSPEIDIKSENPKSPTAPTSSPTTASAEASSSSGTNSDSSGNAESTSNATASAGNSTQANSKTTPNGNAAATAQTKKSNNPTSPGTGPQQLEAASSSGAKAKPKPSETKAPSPVERPEKNPAPATPKDDPPPKPDPTDDTATTPNPEHKKPGNSDDTPEPEGSKPGSKGKPKTPGEKKTPDGKTPQKKPGNKALEKARDKYGKKSPLAKKKDDAKKKLAAKADKLTKGKFSKATGKLGEAKDVANKVKNAANAVQNASENPEQAAQAAGDLAVKGASYIPVYGKAIGAADKLIGETKVGKFIKKIIGGCVCSCCAMGCLSILLVILILLSPILFIFGGGKNDDGTRYIVHEDDFVGVDMEEYERIEEASHSAEGYSLQDLIDEIELGSKDSSKTIQDIFEAVINNKDPFTGNEGSIRYYTQSDVDKYNSEHKDLIDKFKISKLEAGDLTSFGMAFELLGDNYTISNLKMPSLAPEREKNGNKYVSYDPSGKHQALFEDALNNIPKLKNRFKNQVKENWFDKNLVDILDKKFDVYIADWNETRTLSLRDLFKEVSIGTNDAEYDQYTVLKILSDTVNNTEIINQYYTLKENLASLELLTYMLHYQKFYNEKEELRDNMRSHNATNVDMYNDEFFSQFLSFSDIQEFIALSTLSDHSFAYEIACATLDMNVDEAKVTYKTVGGKNFALLQQYSNWYATYIFSPKITLSTDGGFTYEMPCTSLDKTSIQQKLFDKYNIESNARYKGNTYSENSSESNATNFFSIFELATGISMSVGEDGTQTPVYQLDANAIVTDSYHVAPIQDPNAPVTLSFGASYSPQVASRYSMDHDHNGIDYGVSSGTTVYATASGTAYTVHGNTGFGNYTKILHDDGYVSIYAHGNGTFYVQNGSRVVAGQPIMQSGNSGNSTGPHLHFEVRNPAGKPINPTSYMYGQA